MEKRVFQKLFKDYMKNLGFRAKGNLCYMATFLTRWCEDIAK